MHTHPLLTTQQTHLKIVDDEELNVHTSPGQREVNQRAWDGVRIPLGVTLSTLTPEPLAGPGRVAGQSALFDFELIIKVVMVKHS